MKMTESELITNLKAGAKNKEPQSCHELAELYYHGQGDVSQDYGKAVNLFLVAAECGDYKAQYFLGVMYQKGQGVLQDYVRAHMWYNLATSNGYEEAVDARDEIEKKMSSDQVEESQELMWEWMENRHEQDNT